MKLDSRRWDSTPQLLRLSHVSPFKLASTLCPHRVHFLLVATNWFSLSKAVEADPIRFSVRPYYCYIYEPSRFLSFSPIGEFFGPSHPSRWFALMRVKNRDGRESFRIARLPNESLEWWPNFSRPLSGGPHGTDGSVPASHSVAPGSSLNPPEIFQSKCRV